MPVYQLHPVEGQLGSVHWNNSTYRGRCFVTAESETTARHYATRAFAFRTQSAPAEWIRFNPWTRPEFVACTEVTGIGGAPPDGGIVRSR